MDIVTYFENKKYNHADYLTSSEEDLNELPDTVREAIKQTIKSFETVEPIAEEEEEEEEN